MPERNYWLDLFTPQTWNEFVNAGSKISGFRKTRWPAVQQIQKRDYLLCYVTGISRWIAVLEVTSKKAFGTEVLKLWNAVEVCRRSVHFRAIPSAIRANVRCEMWMQTAGERSFLDSVTGASGMEVIGITVACVAATACLYLGLSLGDALR